MAIKELFYDNRPRVLLDPRASQRIDPRFTFTRPSIGTFVDDNGSIQTASANEPRFDHDPVTGESLGLLIEESRTNSQTYSNSFSTNWALNQNGTTTVTPSAAIGPSGQLDATKLSNTDGAFILGPNFITGSNIGFGYSATFNLSTGDISTVKTVLSASLIPVGNGWFRCAFVPDLAIIYAQSIYVKAAESSIFTIEHWADAIRLSVTGGIGAGVYIWGSQVELGSSTTSYIPTTTSAVTRAQDLISIEAPLPATGSVYIDARAIAVEENDTLLSLKNDSNNKIDLAYLFNAATYDSLALIASYDGASKASLPLPVPTTDRERNIITYGAYNYQYGRDSSRFAASLSSSVPTDLNKLSIGHDSVDPTKAFNGYINTVYAWLGELTPEVAEALVRGEIDAIDADNYNPIGPVGSLALVINTQGTAADGDKTFTLPAESVATDNDIVITWGDGTESGLEGAAAELGAIGLTHEYPAAGIYNVWVEGKMQNIQYNNIINPDDLLLIAEWGTGDMLTAPSTMNGAFYGCSQMDFSSSARNTNRPDTSAVTDWENAFRDCSSITGTFPSFDFTAATTFSSTWNGCSSLASIPAIFVADGNQTQNVTNFKKTWHSCSSLTSFPLINTSSGTDFSNAWQGCSSINGTFPSINTSSGTNFSGTWGSCSSLTSFPLINTSSGTNFTGAWRDCSSLTSFPLINTSSGTSFNQAWNGCNSFTSFPLIDTSSGTNFGFAWSGCSSLTSFPLIDTSSGTTFNFAWNFCSSLTSFPLINTSSGTSFSYAWAGCSSLTSFPLINTSLATNFNNTWSGCTNLNSFPLIDTSGATNFNSAWSACSNLTSFPLVDTSSGTNFVSTWGNLTNLTSFPLVDTSSGTDFNSSWFGCSSLTSFPLIDTSSGTNFGNAWLNCSNLEDFPASFFDSWAGTPANQCFYGTWSNCSNLTATSVDNILVSIAASGVSAPSGTGTNDKSITIDYDGTILPGTTATAITTLKSRNWDIYLNGVQQ
jgi:hypothetical protein